jgi:hypothetical protein
MRRVWPFLALVACGKPPPPKPPPAEHAADKVADIAGRWVTSDDMDNGYTMTIAADGTIDVWIDRGKVGRCEQKGTIAPAGSRTFKVTYTRGECNPQAVNVPFDMKVGSFTGDAITILVDNEPRTYQRAPDEGPQAERGQPAQLQ